VNEDIRLREAGVIRSGAKQIEGETGDGIDASELVHGDVSFIDVLLLYVIADGVTIERKHPTHLLFLTSQPIISYMLMAT
jgi:hypothetical protein